MFVRRLDPSPAAKAGRRLAGLATASLLAVLGLALGASPAIAALPQSSSIQALSAGYAAVTVKGTVDPGDEDSTWWAETSLDNVHWSGNPGPFGALAAHTGPHIVEATVTDEEGKPAKFLLGATRYYVRLVVSNGTLLTYSTQPNPFVTTLPVTPPKVLATDNAGGVTYTTAKVSGSVERPANTDPAFNSTCAFEYIIHSQFVLTGFKEAAKTPCNVNPVTAPGANPVSAELTGLKPGATYHLRLTASNPGGSSSLAAAATFTTTAISPPSVTISPATLGIGTAAHFSGTINPQLGPGGNSLYEVRWHFECTPKCLGPNGEPLSGAPIAPDNSSHPVSADVVLEPNTEYHVTLVASNAGATATSGAVTLSTPPFLPIARTLGVGVGSGSANLGAKINPLNAPVTYQFEWGPTVSYGNLAPATPQSVPRADNAYHFVSAPISGLGPATSYHYRVIATNTQTSEKAFGADRTFTTLPIPVAPAPCANEVSRFGPSAALPDCRVFEFTTPGLAGAAPASGWPGLEVEGVREDGTAIAFVAAGAPEEAEGNTSVDNTFLARLGAAGWGTRSLSAATPTGSGTYFGSARSTVGISADLDQSVLWSNQPLAGAASPSGTNLYLRRADGTVIPLTTVGAPQFSEGGELSGASKDFSRLFIVSTVRQLSGDPVNGGNTYEWVAGRPLQLVTILPGAGEVPAPDGGHLPQGALPAVSEDGSQVLFKADGLPGLYLRSDGQSSVEVSASRRTTPDPNPVADAKSVGISADGSKVLFTSASELTNDANTGKTGVTPNDKGADLYSYDVASGQLTDLTVDTAAADGATGADVEQVVGAGRDASYVYFIASGDLAPGATSGERNLYVEHAGTITFIGSNPTGSPGQGYPFYVTPSGLYAAFTATEGQTGYDNAGHSEVYKYTYGGGLECASCRPSGEAPTGDASITGRTISDDGARVFFQSDDAVLPQAQSSQANVFEYEAGEVHLLSPGDGNAAVLAGASASGDDVFIATFQELSPQGQGPVFAIYDARVGAEVPATATTPDCQGEGCRGAPPAAPAVPGAGTAGFEAPGRISAPALKVVKGSKVALRVIVPGAGQLTVVGRGLGPVKLQATKAGATTITLALKPGAERKRRQRGVFRTEAEILFRSLAGEVARADVELGFEGPRKRRGQR